MFGSNGDVEIDQSVERSWSANDWCSSCNVFGNSCNQRYFLSIVVGVVVVVVFVVVFIFIFFRPTAVNLAFCCDAINEAIDKADKFTSDIVVKKAFELKREFCLFV